MHLVFARQRELGTDRARVLEPHLMLAAVAPVIVVRRLRGLVKLDGRAHLDRLLDRLHIADRPRAGLPADEGKRPVIAIIGNTEEDLIRRDDRGRKPHNLLDLVERRHRHRLGESVTPFIRVRRI